MTTTKKISELESIRGVSIIAVVLIHITAMMMENIYHSENNMDHVKVLLIIINLLGRFSVPAFLFISGFLIVFNFENKSYTLKKLIIRQTENLLWPYIFWTMLGFFLFPSNENVVLNIIKSIFGMGVFYQLYYIPLLFQLYFLTPFIISFDNRRVKKMKGIIFFTIIYLFLYQFFFINNFKYLPVLFSKSWELLIQPTFPALMIFYVVGCVVAFDYKNIINKINNFRILYVSILWTISCLFQLTDFFISYKFSNDLNNSLSFCRVSVVIYSFCSITLIFKLSMKKLLFHRFILFLGKNSFGIFLSHVLILKVIYRTVPYLFKSLIFIPISLSLVLLICIFINLMIRLINRKLSKYIVGK